MAHSRLDRVGTIFSRVTSLIQGKALVDQNLPLWYAIYKAFPPKYEPRYDRPASNEPIRQIFYEEDLIRAKFHQDVSIPMINLRNNKPTNFQLFLIFYKLHKKDGLKEMEAYDQAMEQYQLLISAKPEDKQKLIQK